LKLSKQKNICMKENRDNSGIVKNILWIFVLSIESSTINYLINCQTCVEVALVLWYWKTRTRGKEIQFEKKVGNDLLWIDQVMKIDAHLTMTTSNLHCILLETRYFAHIYI
jgi:hypothetical protein